MPDREEIIDQLSHELTSIASLRRANASNETATALKQIERAMNAALDSLTYASVGRLIAEGQAQKSLSLQGSNVSRLKIVGLTGESTSRDEMDRDRVSRPSTSCRHARPASARRSFYRASIGSSRSWSLRSPI
jgi:hypothetical protein